MLCLLRCLALSGLLLGALFCVCSSLVVYAGGATGNSVTLRNGVSIAMPPGWREATAEEYNMEAHPDALLMACIVYEAAHNQKALILIRPALFPENYYNIAISNTDEVTKLITGFWLEASQKIGEVTQYKYNGKVTDGIYIYNCQAWVNARAKFPLVNDKNIFNMLTALIGPNHNLLITTRCPQGLHADIQPVVVKILESANAR